MKQPWPIVKLGEVLLLRRERIALEVGTTYKRITVKLGGLGVVLRDEVDGAAIKTDVQYLARAGQLVVSKIDARNGSFGLIPGALDGSVVSGNFLTFDCTLTRIAPKFIEYYVSRPSFWEECSKISEGTTNRVPVRVEQFLELPIPLPPLAEQRRIVARIEELAAQIHEAQSLRNQAVEEAGRLHAATKRVVFENARKHGERPIEECYDRISNGKRYDKATVSETGTVPVLSQSENSFLGYHNDEPSVGQEHLPLISFANHTCAVRFVDFPFSTIQNVFLLKPKANIEPRFFFHFLHGAVPQEFYGGHWPNVSLLRMPVPPPSDQRRIVAELDALKAEVERLKALQAETATELDALLPSLLDRAFKGEL